MPSEETLAIGPGTTVSVIVHEPGRLEVEASYDGGGSEPPPHLHPAQDERFELLTGTMRTRIEGQLRRGETLEIPAGTVHQMCNAGPQPAALRWTTAPAGRTLDRYRELAAILAGEPLGDPTTLLERYSDVLRLAGA